MAELKISVSAVREWVNELSSFSRRIFRVRLFLKEIRSYIRRSATRFLIFPSPSAFWILPKFFVIIADSSARNRIVLSGNSFIGNFNFRVWTDVRNADAIIISRGQQKVTLVHLVQKWSTSRCICIPLLRVQCSSYFRCAWKWSLLNDRLHHREKVSRANKWKSAE